MNIKTIHPNEDYEQALRRIEELMDASDETEEGDELEALAILVEAYEEKHFPVDLTKT